MQHAYLFEPGAWQANGVHINEAGESFAVTGESVITHEEGLWRVRGTLQLTDDPEISFQTDYRLKPFPDDADSTTWVSENPVMGRLEGRFALVGEAILSVYRSTDGKHQGTECLHRLASDRYQGFGTLFRGETRVSSWSVELVREAG